MKQAAAKKKGKASAVPAKAVDAQIVDPANLTAESAQPQTPVFRNQYVEGRQKLRSQYATKWEKPGYEASLTKRLQKILMGQKELETNHRRQMIQDERFYEGRLTADDELARRQPAFNDLKVNIIRKTVNWMAGHAKSRANTGHIIASGVGAYAPTPEKGMALVVEEYQRRLGIVQENTGWKYLRNKRIDSACRAGVGYLHHYPSYSVETGKIVIKCEAPHWRNVYYDTNCSDYKNAEFCFVMSQQDAERVKARYPTCAEWINEHQEEYIQAIPADTGEFDSMNGWIGSATGRFGTYSATGDSSSERHQIVVGHVYYRDTVMDGGMPRDIILFCKVATNRDFSQLKIINKPVVMGFARPPVVPLAHSRFSESGLPYTALVRDRRGLARVMNAMIRNWTNLTSSRGLIVNLRGLPQKVNETQYLRAMEMRLKRNNPVIAEYGEPGSTHFENFQVDIKKMADAVAMLHALSKDTTEVHAALMGDKGADTASMLQVMKNDAAISVSEFNDNCDQAVEEDAQLQLSYIEQFNAHIDFGWTNRSGKLIAAAADGDHTIEGNKAWFRVEASNRDESVQQVHMEVIKLMLNSVPGMAVPLYQLFISNLQMPDGQRMLEDIKSVAKQMGQPSLPSLMTEEELQAQAEAQEEQAAMQKRAQEAEIGAQEADAKKSHALAYNAVKRADNPQGLKELELRDTIEQIGRQLELAQAQVSALTGEGEQQ